MRQFPQTFSYLVFFLFLSLTACQKSDKSDGYGNFEATEIIVSSEANCKLELLDVEEGRRRLYRR